MTRIEEQLPSWPVFLVVLQSGGTGQLDTCATGQRHELTASSLNGGFGCLYAFCQTAACLHFHNCPEPNLPMLLNEPLWEATHIHANF